jgi:hypothetical protein
VNGYPYFCRAFTLFLPRAASYTHPVAPEAQPAPPAEPIKVAAAEPIKVDIVEPRRNASWWFTAIGPVLISAAALAIAILALADQHAAEQNAQNTAARTLASEVSFFSAPAGQSQFEIDNDANAQITSVLVQPYAHGPLDSLGTIADCTGISVTLESATAPVVYFRDANGLGWELPLNGTAQLSADPSAIIALAPVGALVTLPFPAGSAHQLQGC